MKDPNEDLTKIEELSTTSANMVKSSDPNNTPNSDDPEQANSSEVDASDSLASDNTQSTDGAASNKGSRAFVSVKKNQHAIVDPSAVENDLGTPMEVADGQASARSLMQRSENRLDDRTPTASNVANNSGRFFQRLKSARQKFSYAASEAMVAATPALDSAKKAVQTAAKEYQTRAAKDKEPEQKPGDTIIESRDTGDHSVSSNGVMAPAVSTPAKTRPLVSMMTPIMQSSVGPHMEAILAGLEQGQHVMLLGHGLLGVNLKDCYKGGVYVDFLTPEGNADKSGLVAIGDVLVKVGDTSVQKLSIHEVPSIIAKAPRPVVITFSRKHKKPPEHQVECSDVDKALAAVLAIQERVKEAREKSIATMPLISVSDDDASKNTNTSGQSFEGKPKNAQSSKDIRDENEDANSSDSSVHIVPVSIVDDNTKIDEDEASRSTLTSNFSETSSSIIPRGVPGLSRTVSRSLADYASRRHLEMSCFAAFKNALAEDDSFRSVMQNGFRAICADARCLPFFATHLSNEDAIDYGTLADVPSFEPSDVKTSISSIKLMLWLEIESYQELWPISTKERRLNHASRIARKFLLSQANEATGNALQFNLKSSIPADQIDKIEKDLQMAVRNFDIARDFFTEVVVHLERTLCGVSFTSFIMSDSFFRMRAYAAGSPKYCHLSLEKLWNNLSSDGINLNHYLHFLLLHLISVTGNRYSTLSAAIFIRRMLDKDVKQKNGERCAERCQHLWDTFLDPLTGLLGRTNSVPRECEECLEKARIAVRHDFHTITCSDGTICLQDFALRDATIDILHELSRELFWQYAVNMYPRFKMDLFHDQFCREALTAALKADPGQELPSDVFPVCAKSFISRLLRTDRLPESFSKHRPHRAIAKSDHNTMQDSKIIDSSKESHAEFAVVFGTNENNSEEESIPHSQSRPLRRFGAVQVGELKRNKESSLQPHVAIVEQIPSSLEEFATLNPGQAIQRPLGNCQRVCTSSDGWEVHLVNFTVPNTCPDFPNNCLYGVSLVLYKDNKATQSDDEFIHSVPTSESGDSTGAIQDIGVEGAERYLTFDIVRKMDKIFKEAPSPVRRQMDKDPWSNQTREGGSTIGIALISNQNTIPAMRSSLNLLFRDLAVEESNKSQVTVVAKGIVDLFGSLSSTSISKEINLKSILLPYLKSGCSTWIDKPLADQARTFERHSVHQLIRCLPPTALALAFLNVLLEQKIVLTSSRRSILLSANVALSALIAPLEWPHLKVPIAPVSMAADLVHYPAPFLIGLPNQEKESQDVLNSLPPDVSLVDLDLGRVILGTKYSSELDRMSSTELRLQVFYLAEELGAWLGSMLCPQAWNCDDPFETVNVDLNSSVDVYEMSKSMCSRFIRELVSGTVSCCAWVEEKWNSGADGTSSEVVVLFDEERFLDLKHIRSLGKKATNESFTLTESEESFGNLGEVDVFALKLQDFRALIETFLRGQAMSAFISSRPKRSMYYY